MPAITKTATSRFSTRSAVERRGAVISESGLEGCGIGLSGMIFSVSNLRHGYRALIARVVELTRRLRAAIPDRSIPSVQRQNRNRAASGRGFGESLAGRGPTRDQRVLVYVSVACSAGDNGRAPADCRPYLS